MGNFSIGSMRPAMMASAAAISIVAATPAMAQTKSFNVPAQPAASGVAALARQGSVQVLISEEDARGKRTAAVKGTMTIEQAFARLLANTGLRAALTGPQTFTVEAGSQAQSSVAAVGSTADDGSEIVVTAQKREQRLQDVPVPVTVANARELAQTNQVRLQDFASTIPGLSVMAVGNGGTSNVSIRGINSGAYTTATVAITVDDVPSYGGLASVFSPVRPDLDPSDIARIEVLRGPQGTLYGASSMGGLINYVTVDPSTAAFSGRIEGGTSRIRNGEGLGYNLRGAINIPLGETFAVRASGYTRKDSGYINNPLTGEEGINASRFSGGRVSALWQPFDNVSVKLAAIYQHATGNNQNEVHVPTPGFPFTTGLSGFEQASIPGTGDYEQDYQNYSAVVKAKFGQVDLVSISAYSHTNWSSSRDLSYAFGSAAQGPYGVSSVGLFNSGKVSRFSQELRMSTPIGSSIDWLAGAFYTHENFPTRQDITALNSSGDPIGSVGFTDTPKTYIEYAAFTDFTINFTDRFNIQLGGRQSHIQIEQHAPECVGGILFGNPPTCSQKPVAKNNVFTYLVTPQFKVSPDLMFYARMASGFRSGQGFNSASLVNPALPATQGPDETRNYEIGAKGNLFDRMLSFDASIYYIDWTDVQLTLVDTNSLSYGTNGARAKSEGVELSLEARPAEGLTISGWGAYSNAVLTRSLGANSTAYGPAGSRLPYSSRYSGNLSIKQNFPISGDFSGFVQGSMNYVGRKIGNFLANAAPRQVYPDYIRIDLNVGVKSDQWSANLYVNNLTDKKGLIGGGVGTSPVFGRYYLQPRTIGISVSREF